MEKHLNKKVVITKEDKNSAKCWSCDNAYVDDDDDDDDDVKEEMSSTRSDV